LDPAIKPELLALCKLELTIAAHAQSIAANRIGAVYHRYRSRQHLKGTAPSASAVSKYSATQSVAEQRETKQKLEALKQKSGADLESRIAVLTASIRANPMDRDNLKRMVELETMQKEYDSYASNLTEHIDKLSRQRAEKRAIAERHAARTHTFRKALAGSISCDNNNRNAADRQLQQLQEREQIIERLLIVARHAIGVRAAALGDKHNEMEADRRIREWERERKAAAAAAAVSPSDGAEQVPAAADRASVVAKIQVPARSAAAADEASSPVAFQFVSADKLSGPIPAPPPGLLSQRSNPPTPAAVSPASSASSSSSSALSTVAAASPGVSSPVAFQFVTADKLSGPIPVAPPGLLQPESPPVSAAAPAAAAPPISAQQLHPPVLPPVPPPVLPAAAVARPSLLVQQKPVNLLSPQPQVQSSQAPVPSPPALQQVPVNLNPQRPSLISPQQSPSATPQLNRMPSAAQLHAPPQQQVQPPLMSRPSSIAQGVSSMHM
jgi:hypothetical protein